MFEIVLTACLSTASVCAERMVPAGYPTAEACIAAAPDRAATWAQRHDLTAMDVRCSDSAPALDVTEIAPGLFVHMGQTDVPRPGNAGDLANLAFVIGKTHVGVIDAGGSRQVAERLYGAIRRQTELPIGWVIVTHMHPDHSLGASVFQEAGAKVIGHRNLARALANRAESYATAMQRLMGAHAFLGTRIVGPDVTDVDQIDLGDRILTITTHATAHTSTDLTVVDQATGTLFTGDLVFSGHTPALDGSILGWQAVLDAMVDRNVQRIVPGHGPAVLPWPEGAAATRAYLAALTRETRAAIAAGESMRTAIRHLGESQRAHWQLFDEFNKRNATAAYKELEWE